MEHHSKRTLKDSQTTMAAPKHLFFDMDGTLTESRSRITPESEELVFDLNQDRDVVIVSGATERQILKQIPFGCASDTLAQNGNAYRTWRNELNWMQKYKIFCLIDHLLGIANTTKQVDHVEDRGCQISYSATGHNAPQEQKLAYDPDGSVRRSVIDQEFGWFKEINFYGIKYAIGGTTCIDFYLHSKGENVARYVKEMGWKPEECLYIGDALFPGGNDETVRGVIPVRQVENLAECAEFMRELLA